MTCDSKSAPTLVKCAWNQRPAFDYENCAYTYCVPRQWKRDIYGPIAFLGPILAVPAVMIAGVVGVWWWSRRRSARPNPAWSAYPTIDYVTGYRDTDAAVRAYLDAPVTRREFNEELERLWQYVDPTMRRVRIEGSSVPDIRFKGESVKTKRADFDRQVQRSVAQLSAGRPLPSYASEEAIAVAQEIVELKQRRKELYSIPHVHDYSTRIKKGMNTAGLDPIALALAEELVLIQTRLKTLTSPGEKKPSPMTVPALPVRQTIEGRCVECGGDLPPGSKPATLYCSKECYRTAKTRRERELRRYR